MGAAALLTAGCASAAGSATASSTSTTARPSAPTAGLTESFASGRLPTGWETAGAVVQTGTSGTSGTSGAEPAAFVRLTAAGSPAYVSPKPRLLETGHAGFTFRGRFRVTARTPGRTVGLATVENTRRTENADLFVDARSGRCRIDLFRDDTALSPTRCDDGRWHTVTLSGDFGSAGPAAGTPSCTWTLTWTLDGRRMPPVRTTGLPPSTVHRLWVGDATPDKTNTTDWTNLELRLS